MQAIRATRSGDSALCHKPSLFRFDQTSRTSSARTEAAAEVFESHRSRLFGVAYRMLKTHADADDVLQDAYLRWHETATNEIESPVGFLITVTTRLCLDRLRQWKNERDDCAESYPPEATVEDYVPSPEEQCEIAGEVSAALLAVLERLGPEERSAFLLREIFDYDYAEVAQMVCKTESACRQLIHRSRTRLRRADARYAVTPQCLKRVLEKFLAATATGDRQAVRTLLAEEIDYVRAA
jgi:RNA polymerase sigma-70 factor (ECF subfamily)